MAHMHNPPHPGEILRDTVLREDGGITLAAFANVLRISGGALARVVRCKTAVSPELAIRVAAALGGTAESWLRLQRAYDSWEAEER